MQGTRVTRTQYGFRTLQESSAKMCLKVTGYPLPEITWYKDDVQLHEDERHTFYADEDGFFAMTIDPVQVEDTGRYTCMATNEYGQASTSAFFRVLKVEKEAAPPRFVNTLKDQECKEGEVISFECEVEGWPEPELVWLVDDQPLRPSHDFKIEYDGMNAKLEIRDAQPDDTGVYCVKIQNEFGTAESKAELTVIPDPDKNHVAPEFQATIEDVECDEGDEVRFKSVITGDPNPDIIWMINGIPLTESEKIRFISEDGICILIIKDVTRHFDGTVTCQGTNRLGTTSCDGRLKVRVPPAPPSFAKPLEDRIVQENAVVGGLKLMNGNSLL
ncbi:immunoglobulin I-set domain protein [Ancylostoma caninum]|uniref:Immunoglobulin I-set domain protein n=1 Tax=Ancylostoma caninum TaxID=29170 RepID=A0A368GSB6_ANCCA|nr:immunoglobulin I-set domain protein [Ancylostoma caninum]